MPPEASVPQATQRRRRPSTRAPSALQNVDDASSPEDDARLLLGAHVESDSISDDDKLALEDEVGGSSDDYPSRASGAVDQGSATTARERLHAESPVLAHQPQKELDYEDLAKYFHLPITEGTSARLHSLHFWRPLRQIFS